MARASGKPGELKLELGRTVLSLVHAPQARNPLRHAGAQLLPDRYPQPERDVLVVQKVPAVDHSQLHKAKLSPVGLGGYFVGRALVRHVETSHPIPGGPRSALRIAEQ